MRTLRIRDGRVSSGHYIYIRDFGRLTAPEILQSLGLYGYIPDPDPQFPCHYAHVIRYSDWFCYADDWFYTVYNSPGTSEAVSKLGRNHEVLRVAIGDADQSFEFYHFLGGVLRRGFHFNDYGGKSSVILDTGTPIQCEKGFRLGTDPRAFLCSVTDEIGIKNESKASSVQTFSKPYQGR